MRILYPFARRFIAGEDLATALRNICRLNEDGYLCTIDVLGEDTHSPEQAANARDEYIALLRAIETHPTPQDLSVKLSQMGLAFDYNLCKQNVEAVIDASGQNTVRFDMEGSNLTQGILDMCLDLHETHPSLGIVVQAYLHRTEKDVATMVDKQISVRLCKGAYKEPEDIAYQDMEDIRENFLKLACVLLKEGYLPAIATHDETLIREVLKFIKKENIQPEQFYFELLYGVRRDLQQHLLDLGYRVRIYVPYGSAWLPYTLRRLAERKENILFVVKSLVRETLGLGKLGK
ncbi:proline dehydrogenase family protein [Nitrospina sp. 32_T5]|uniref:proline dehydrogenase family protein n=1 Tax=unclassified Nitrospina TaxID=2638683 RepID=UPI003F975650